MKKVLNTINDITFEELNNFIINLNSKIEFRVFPIYVRYMLNDEIIVLMHFDRKKSEFNIGFKNIKKEFRKEFQDGRWMKYNGINYCLKINPNSNLKKIKSLIKNAVLI